MKKGLKKILACALAVMMLVCSVPMTNVSAATATSGTCGDNVIWEITGDTLIISGEGEMTDYYGDSSLLPWYEIREQIKKAVIAEGVESIGAGAFSNIPIETVEIADSVKEIGTAAFFGTKIVSIKFNEYVVLNTEKLFFNCQYLESVNIPASTTSIDNYAFWNCVSLKEIDIPATVTSIEGGEIFDRCTSMKKITVNNPDCVYDMDSPYVFPAYTDNIVYGYSGSTTEAYCNKYGYKFEVISSEEIPSQPDTDVTDIPVSDSESNGEENTEEVDCSCMCHKSGFMGFIYTIARFFWKLFKTKLVCACGAVHY